MNLTPLPEPFYITRSNGRLYEVESGADVTGRVIDAYMQDQLRQAQRAAVAAYKAELFQKYESSTERATEAEGGAFTHGYLCGEVLNAVLDKVAKWQADGRTGFCLPVLDGELLEELEALTNERRRDTLREVLAAAAPEVNP